MARNLLLITMIFIISTLFVITNASNNIDIKVFPAEGYTMKSYESLTQTIKLNLTRHENEKEDLSLELCLAHGNNGLSKLTDYLLETKNAISEIYQTTCKNGIIALGAIPSNTDHEILRNNKVLFLAGDVDGVLRFSNFAVAKHEYETTFKNYHFGLIQGASHHSFASSDDSNAIKNKYDLESEIDIGLGHEKIACIVSDFIFIHQNNVVGNDLAESKALALKLAGPILKALQLEGSSHTGQDVCNSDFPTNSKCNYPKYPDFSLPPGPAKPPSPLPSSSCICGSDWVEDYAFPLVSGAADVGFKLIAADAFHSVSDVHPFHLPHIWNKCGDPSGCTLNVTTLTENFPGSGNLFPNTTSGAPLSALELRTKMKSRTTLYKAVGLKPSSNVDKNYTLCRSANEEAWQWALNNAEESVRKRFEASGEPFVMVDDKEAPIGLKGPQWIEKTLVYNRVNNGKNGQSHIEVQSWTFVVGDFPVHSKYLPTGMHYCKLLSPARAMEWIYTDSLRMKLGV